MIDIESIKAMRRELSFKLFGKHEKDLNLKQTHQLDLECPGWVLAKTKFDKVPLVEVSMGGTRVRDLDKQELRIYYPHNHLGNNSYPFVILVSKEFKTLSKQVVHRLVAQAFVPNDTPSKKKDVNHIDGNKWNNAYWNLEWVTKAENTKHAYRTGLIEVGEKHSNARCTNGQIEEVCKLLSDPKYAKTSFAEIAEKCKVPKYVVVSVYYRKSWLHISNTYDFVEREINYVYTEDQINEVCIILSNPDYVTLTFHDISDMTGVDPGTIGQIYRKTEWKHITDKYIFPVRDSMPKGEKNPSSLYTNQQALQVCDLLDQVYHGNIKMTHKQIADRVDVSLSMVDKINAKRIWTSIAKDFDFYKNKNERED